MTSLGEEECWARLAAADHGILATVHPERGVDAVPVVFALDGRTVVLPVDTVKAKRTNDLQRATNLAGDPRCVLLVEHYADDWDELWWVRAHGRASPSGDVSAAHVALLAARYPEYAAPGAVTSTIVLEPQRVRGWSQR